MLPPKAFRLCVTPRGYVTLKSLWFNMIWPCSGVASLPSSWSLTLHFIWMDETCLRAVVSPAHGWPSWQWRHWGLFEGSCRGSKTLLLERLPAFQPLCQSPGPFRRLRLGTPPLHWTPFADRIIPTPLFQPLSSLLSFHMNFESKGGLEATRSGRMMAALDLVQAFWRLIVAFMLALLWQKFIRT